MDLKNNQLNEEETALLNAMPWLNEDKVEKTVMSQLMNGQRILGVADPTGLSQAEQQARVMAEKWLYQLGVSYETATAHRLGVLPNWTDPAHNDGASEPAMLLPTGEHVITSADGTAVSVNDGYVAYGLQTGRRCAVSPRSKRAYLFGSPNLEMEGARVFVTKSELDALMIMARGLKAVAAFGERGGEWLVKKLSERRHKLGRDYHPVLLLAFGNNEAEHRESLWMQSQLRQAEIACYAAPQLLEDADGKIYPSVVAMAQDPVGQQVLTDNAWRISSHPADRAHAFNRYRQEQSQRSVMPTGFGTLDDLLGGGLHEGLHILGAVSSLGKTTFALQVADYLAVTGHPVIYYTLEMTWQQMHAKTLSRLSFINNITENSYDPDVRPQGALTSQEALLSDAVLNGAHRQGLRDAQKRYDRWIENVEFHDASIEGRPTVKQIQNDVDHFIKSRGEIPAVFIDYLQIMAVDERYDEKKAAKNNVMTLRTMSMAYHTPILLISSLNRASYSSPVTQSAFKESGDIEYSADVLMGMQYHGVGEEGFSFEEAKSQRLRDVDLVILKNRGGFDGKVRFRYDAAYNCYVPMDAKRSSRLLDPSADQSKSADDAETDTDMPF